MNKIFQIIRSTIQEFPVVRKIGEKKFYGIAGAALAVIILLAIAVPKPPDSDVRGTTAQVLSGDFLVSIVESGEIQAETQVTINAPAVYGVTLQIIDLVPEGTMVSEGDFLMRFDASELETRKSLREDELESLRADLEKMKSQHQLTLSNLENTLKLANYSYEQAELNLKIRQYESETSKEEARLQLKQAELDLNRSKKQLESQKIINQSQIIKMMSSIKQAEHRLETLLENIDKCEVRASTNGMVVYQEVGSWRSRERLKNGYKARRGESLMAIPDMSSMIVRFFVNELDRLTVKKGQRVQIALEAYPDVKLGGSITSVAQLAQPVEHESSLKEFEVIASLDTTLSELKPGITAKVTIELESYQDVVYAPTGAVFEYKDQTVVFPGNKRKPYAVYTGARNDGYIIIERGLSPGMELMLYDPTGNAHILGYAEESGRIEEVKAVMSGSFDVFRRLGILYEYSSEEKQGKTSSNAVKKLPSFLKKRLNQGANEQENKPDVKVGSTAEAGKNKTFNVSSDMMKRLKKSGGQDKQTSNQEKNQ